jgi:valyl-tRNA synthetase
MALLGQIRREKSESKMPLNTPIKLLTIYAEDQKNTLILDQVANDIAGTCKTEKIEIIPKKGKGKELEGHADIHYVIEY